jgi:hypothetical protein
MTSKIYKVTITLPDLAAAHAEQEIKVESGNWATAVKLACDEISKRPHVRGKHIKSAKLFFSVVGLKDPSEALTAAKSANPGDEANGQGSLFDL